MDVRVWCNGNPRPCQGLVESSILSTRSKFCPGGVMVATLVLETSAQKACEFESHLGHQYLTTV